MFSLHQSLTSEPTGLTLRTYRVLATPTDYLLEYDVPVRGQFDRPLAQILSSILKPLRRVSRIKYTTCFKLAQDIVR